MSKCPSFSRIQLLCSSCRQWLTALSMISWSKWWTTFLNQSFFQMINVTDPVTATAGLAAHPVYAAQPLRSVGVYVEKKCHSTVQNGSGDKRPAQWSSCHTAVNWVPRGFISPLCRADDVQLVSHGCCGLYTLSDAVAMPSRIPSCDSSVKPPADKS